MDPPLLPVRVPQNEDKLNVAPKSGWEVFGTEASTDTTHLPNEKVHRECPAEGEVGADNRDKIASMFQASRSNTPSSVKRSHRPILPGSARSRPSTAIPNLAVEKNHDKPHNAILSAIFLIEKTSYDVQLYEDRIAWTPVDQLYKKSKPDVVERTLIDHGQVFIHQISAVRLKNIRNVKAKKITTIGFAIFTAGSKGEKLREHSTHFLCYSREICVLWASKIKAAIIARTDRPTHLLVISPNIFMSTSAWSSVVEPRLQTVGIKYTHKEFKKGDNVSEYVKKMLSEQSACQDSESFQGIVVIGKLAFFSEIVSAMIEFKNDTLKSGTWLNHFPAIGYIPSASNNFVGKELHRNSDAETAVLHVIYGCTQSIPICEFYDKDGNFLRYGLTASYGFSGGDTANDTAGSGFRHIQGSFRKSYAMTKAIVQRRSYPCEILYKDASLKFEPFDDDELFAEQEFAKFSIVNKHYVDDEEKVGEKTADYSNPSPRSDQQASSDSDSGVWPKQDNWNTVQRNNYLDVMVTSLPQHFNEDASLEPPLSALLVRETMSRKDLFANMGSQVSLSSNMGKSKPEVLDKTDIVKGKEIIIKACADRSTVNAQAASKWCIDDVCLPPSIQELHVKVAEIPLLMYSRGANQPLSTESGIKILRLDPENGNVTVDSLA